MSEASINVLNDLKNFRSAPKLSLRVSRKLFNELQIAMKQADWFTVGIMALSADQAISTLREIENKLSWPPMRSIEEPNKNGPVFLKANQQTGQFHTRIEEGLGEGILISGQSLDSANNLETWGPLPLDFFKT